MSFPRICAGAFVLLGVLLACGTGTHVHAWQVSNEPTVTPPDYFGVAVDSRLKDPRSLDSYFPLTVPDSLEQWEERKVILRDRLEFSLGLKPSLPRKTPTPVIHSTQELDGYRLSKVYLESLPGFYVTGSLYRPSKEKVAAGPCPGILCPHGHWQGGRMVYFNDDAVETALEDESESLDCAARSPLQARCVHLARMGCVVFHYDMIGYADSQQISSDIAHGFSRQRLKMATPEEFGLFSPAAEMNNLNVMGLQTINSIVSLDFLCDLPEVDQDRLGITGASGGGTQSFVLAALDPRLDLAFPAVMVGTAMQGGCTCENCCNLRTRQGNVDIAAMFAPKPLGMTAADDWTKELETKGFPELQKVYELYEQPAQVHLTSRTEFGHNYNQVGRRAMYQWVAEHFDLEFSEEHEFPLQLPQNLSVWRVGDVPIAEDPEFLNEWNGQTVRFPTLEKGEPFERRLLAWLTRQKKDHRPETSDDFLRTWRAVYFQDRPDDLATADEDKLRWKPLPQAQALAIPDAAVSCWALESTFPNPQVLPVRIIHAAGVVPEQNQPQLNDATLLYLGDGHGDLLDSEGRLCSWARKALQQGRDIVQVDLFGQGEFRTAGQYSPLNVWGETSREVAGYTYGYNLPDAIHRARDIRQLLRGLQLGKTEQTPQKLSIAAAGQGAIALTLLAPTLQVSPDQGPLQISNINVIVNGFRFAEVNSLLDPNFVPGVLNWGDVPQYWQAYVTQAEVPVTLYDHKLEDWTESIRQLPLLTVDSLWDLKD